jgi:hypothetical protein
MIDMQTNDPRALFIALIKSIETHSHHLYPPIACPSSVLLTYYQLLSDNQP